jgi:DNA-binding response OmpR family regulator
MRVLVVEDHATLAGRIAQGYARPGWSWTPCTKALDTAPQTAYHVIVLDRDLPVMHGDRVCRTMASSGPRILMLAAAADADDRVDRLELNGSPAQCVGGIRLGSCGRWPPRAPCL